MEKLRVGPVLAALLGWVAACGKSATTPPDGDMVVTFRVASRETYRIRLTDPADMQIARQLLAGATPLVPNGVVIRGAPDVNVGYSWHIDPQQFDFAGFTTEVCDGLPSDVEKGAITSNRYCPAAARVIAVEE